MAKTKSKNKIPPHFLKKYFWDVEFKELNLDENESFITERLLEYGDPKAIKWLLNHVKEEAIKNILFTKRGLSFKSANFWAIFFGWPRNKILCLKKSYLKMQKSHWPY
jgi:hypothetical protein